MQTTQKIIFRFWLILFLVGLTPLGLSLYFYYQKVTNEIATNAEEILRARANGIITYVDTWMDMSLRLLRQNAALEDIISMNPTRQLPVVKSIFKEYEDLMFIVHTIDLKGQDIVRVDPQPQPLMNFFDRVWFQQALVKPYGTSVQASRTHGRPSWSLAVPILKERKVIGVLQFSSFISNLSEKITNAKVGKTGYAYLLSEEGKVVAHYKKNYTQIMADFSQHPVLVQLGKDNEKKITFIEESTNKPVIAFTKRSQYGWIVTVQQDQQEAFASVIKVEKFILMILGTAVVVIILMGVVYLKWARYVEKKQSSSFSRQSLINKWGVVVMVVTVIPFGVMWGIFHSFSKDQLSAHSDQLLAAKSDALVSYIDTWVDMTVRMLRQNATLKDIKSMDPKIQKPLLSTIAQHYSWAWIHTMDLKGQNIARSDKETMKNFAHRDWFKIPASGKPLGSDITYTTSHNRAALTLAVPIFDEGQKVKGVIALSGFIVNLTGPLTQERIGETGYAFLLTDKGKVVAHRDNSFVQAVFDFSKLPAFTELKQKNQSKAVFIEPVSKRRVVSHSQPTRQGWVVVVQQDYDEIYKPVSKLNQFMLIMMGTVLLIAILGILVGRRWITAMGDHK